MEQKDTIITDRGFRLENLGKGYRTSRVLSHISCRITPGMGWGILGNSGSGKSTLLRLMAGLEIPDRGSIYLNGKIISCGGKIIVAPRARKISMVFQDLALWPNLTVMENVIMGMDKACMETARNSLSMCGIARAESKYPGELSGGEQQRLALARALATRPEFLFLDEPFNGLDIEIKNNIIRKIRALTEENHITVILVSHDPFEVLSLCTQVMVLQNGKIAESGKLNSLMTDPASDVLKAFREYIHTLKASGCGSMN